MKNTNDILQSETGVARYDASAELKRISDQKRYRELGADAANQDMQSHAGGTVHRLLSEDQIIGDHKGIFNELKASVEIRCNKAEQRRRILDNDLHRLVKDDGYLRVLASDGPRPPHAEDSAADASGEHGRTPLGAAVEKAIGQKNRLMAVSGGKARQAYREMILARGVLSAFRVRNSIEPSTRMAEYSESPLVDVAIIVLFALIEIAGNGYFFLNAGSFGALEGLFKVIFFAPINVISASLVGILGLRYAAYSKGAKRLAGFAFTGSMVLFLIFMNVYMAAVRLSLDPDNGYTVAQIISFIFSKHILDVAGYESLGLFVLGILMAFLSGWKAFRIFDSCPGFTEVTKDYRAKEEHYGAIRNDCRDQIEDIHKAAIEALQGIYEDAERSANWFRRLTEAAQSEAVNGEKSRVEITEACDQALKNLAVGYHMVNEAADEAQREIDESSFSLDLPDLTADLKQADVIDRQVLDQIESVVHRYKEALNTHFLAELETLVDFFREIEEEERSRSSAPAVKEFLKPVS